MNSRFLNGNWKQCCRKKSSSKRIYAMRRGNSTFLCIIESSHKENCYNSVFGLLKLVSVDWVSSRMTASIWMTLLFLWFYQPKGWSMDKWRLIKNKKKKTRENFYAGFNKEVILQMSCSEVNHDWKSMLILESYWS